MNCFIMQGTKGYFPRFTYTVASFQYLLYINFLSYDLLSNAVQRAPLNDVLHVVCKHEEGLKSLSDGSLDHKSTGFNVKLSFGFATKIDLK
jgi:hypothetical protein